MRKIHRVAAHEHRNGDGGNEDDPPRPKKLNAGGDPGSEGLKGGRFQNDTSMEIFRAVSMQSF
jgi:hypothetical protein